jgi:hypothetical protein
MGAGERFVLLKLLLLFNFNFLRKRKVKQQSKLVCVWFGGSDN